MCIRTRIRTGQPPLPSALSGRRDAIVESGGGDRVSVQTFSENNPRPTWCSLISWVVVSRAESISSSLNSYETGPGDDGCHEDWPIRFDRQFATRPQYHSGAPRSKVAAYQGLLPRAYLASYTASARSRLALTVRDCGRRSLYCPSLRSSRTSSRSARR